MSDNERYTTVTVPCDEDDQCDGGSDVPAFTKYDTGKEPISLIPPRAIRDIAAVLGYGAQKYAPNNWQKVDVRSRYLNAAMRHLLAYAEGEDIDKESGLQHLAHAAASICFLLARDRNGRPFGKDDRS